MTEAMCLVQTREGLVRALGGLCFKKNFENLSYYCYYKYIKLFILYYHKKEPGFFQLQGIVFVSLIIVFFRSRIGKWNLLFNDFEWFGFLDDMTKLFAD